MPTILEYRIGATWERVFKWRNNGTSVKITAVQAIFEVCTSVNGEVILSKEGIIYEDEGDVIVNLTATETAELTAGHYMVRVKLLFPAGVVKPTDWAVLRAKRGT